MRLIFLGTGSAGGIPRLGHRDKACRAARLGGKSRRMRSAVLLQVGKGRALVNVLIDSGPDILAQLRRERVQKIDLVCLTHGHHDAVGGMEDLQQWLASKGLTIPVVTDPATWSHVIQHFGSMKQFQYLSTRPFRLVRIASISLVPFRVRHATTPGFPTLGFFFGKRLAYSSDVAAIPAQSARLLQGIGALVLDGTKYFGSSMASHLSTETAIQWGAKLKVRRLILTQIGHTYPPHQQAVRAIHRYVSEQNIRRPKILLAFDGMKIEI